MRVIHIPIHEQLTKQTHQGKSTPGGFAYLHSTKGISLNNDENTLYNRMVLCIINIQNK